MTGGRIPINQLNALPIITVAQWLSPITLPPPTFEGAAINGKLLRYWSPAATGIDGTLSSNIADPRLPPSQVYLISNWLDLTGLDAITLTMCGRRGPAGIGDVRQNWNVYAVPYGSTNLGVVEPVTVTPGPDLHNLTYGYADQGGFPLVGTLTQGLLTGALYAENDVKLGAIGMRVGFETNNTMTTGMPCGVMRFMFLANTGNDPLFQYLSVYGQG